MQNVTATKPNFLSTFFGKSISKKLADKLNSDEEGKPKEIAEKFFQDEGYRDVFLSYSRKEGDSSEVLAVTIQDTDQSFLLNKTTGERWNKL